MLEVIAFASFVHLPDVITRQGV